MKHAEIRALWEVKQWGRLPYLIPVEEQDQINKLVFWAVLMGTEEASIKNEGIHKSLKNQSL